MTPRVTVGLPVRNGARFLDGALSAILGQSYRGFHLLIADNASTDDTERICRDYQRQDSRVEYHRHPRNLGAAGNVNWLLDHANTEYVLLCAHDDRLAPDALERMVTALDGDPTAAVAFGAYYLSDDKLIPAEYRRSDLASPWRIIRLAKFLWSLDDACTYGLLRRSLARSRVPTWRGPNTRSVFGCAYPFVLGLLAAGNFAPVYGSPLVSFRSGAKPHSVPGQGDRAVVFARHILRVVECAIRSLGEVCRQSPLAAAGILPALAGRAGADILAPIRRAAG